MKPLIIAILILLNFYSIAQIDSVSGTYTLSTQRILIGEQLKLNLMISVPKGFQVDWNSIKDSLSEEVEILNESKTDTLPSDKQSFIKLSKQLLITVFDSGNYFTKPVYLKYSSPSEKLFFTVSGDSLIVNYPNVDVAKDFKDIKIIEDEPFSFKEYLIYIQILAGIILLLTASYIIHKRIKQKKSFIPIFQAKPKPAHVIALNALKILENKKLWQNGEYKNYYSELTDIFRSYLENRYSLSAMESLSSEIISDLLTLPLDETLVNKIRIVLEISDNVKFAKADALADENLQSFNSIVEFIETTKDENINSGKEAAK